MVDALTKLLPCLLISSAESNPRTCPTHADFNQNFLQSAFSNFAPSTTPLVNDPNAPRRSPSSDSLSTMMGRPDPPTTIGSIANDEELQSFNPLQEESNMMYQQNYCSDNALQTSNLLRFQNFSEPEFSQFPMAPNVYHQQGRNSSMLSPDRPMPHGDQEFNDKNRRLNQARRKPNAFDQQRSNSMLCEPSRPSGRPPQLSDHCNQVPLASNEVNPQHPNSIMPEALLSRVQKLQECQRQLEQLQMEHDQLIGSQHSSFMLPLPSIISRPRNVELLGLQNQKSGRVGNPSFTSHQRQIFNSGIPQEIGGQNTGVAVPHLLEESSGNHNERDMLERCRLMQDALGSLYSRSKRKPRKERFPPVLNTQQNDDLNDSSASNPNDNFQCFLKSLENHVPSTSGQIKNAVYDPDFAEIGLPVDPYLRLFCSRKFPGNGAQR